MDYILQGHNLCFQVVTDMSLSTCATLRARLTGIVLFITVWALI
jgi:hypothetical protein